MHGHSLLTTAGLVALIAFVFGTTAARWIVGIPLVAGAGFVLYVLWRIVDGTI